ncbi:MAG: nucleotidyltransferase domain-containing protein [Microcoleaceae cyanobacterium]
MPSLTVQLNQKLRSLLNELKQSFQAEYGNRLVKMILFGSQARGDAIEGSDIDVLVVLCGEVTPSVEILRTEEIVGDISLKYDEVLSCLFMAETRFLNHRNLLLHNIHSDGIVI